MPDKPRDVIGYARLVRRHGLHQKHLIVSHGLLMLRDLIIVLDPGRCATELLITIAYRHPCQLAHLLLKLARTVIRLDLHHLG